MKNLRRRWTRQEESDLLKWASQGVSVLLMAARLKRSLSAVHDRLTILRKRQKARPQPPRSDAG
jgi:cephalosporin-C deacetylase-like acetyl esterase